LDKFAAGGTDLRNNVDETGYRDLGQGRVHPFPCNQPPDLLFKPPSEHFRSHVDQAYGGGSKSI
jgi:hypothetical protein